MLHNLENKTQCELIQLLIEELKQGNVDQFDLFVSLVNRALLLDLDKKKVEMMLQDLLAYCNKALEQNDGQADFLLGTLCEFGYGFPVSRDQAIVYYDLAISYDNPAGMNNRAIIHECGYGGIIDKKTAIIIYKRAVERGLAVAMNNRGRMYQNGQGGEVDYPAAIALYQKSIKYKQSGAAFFCLATHV
jgi:TPR repeat protein